MPVDTTTFFLTIIVAINVYYVYQNVVFLEDMIYKVKKLQQELDDLKKEDRAVFQKQVKIEKIIRKLEQKIFPPALLVRKIKKAPSVYSVIHTWSYNKRYNSLYDMAATDDKRVWVGGHNRELKLFDLQGTLHRTVTIPCIGYSICLYNKELVFTDYIDNAVKKVSDDSTVVTMFTTGDWKPYGITSSASSDLLVCLRKDDQSKVVRYNSTGTVLQEIQSTCNAQPKDSDFWDMFIAENVNGDIIVTDSKKGHVTAVDRLGIFRYSYFGSSSPCGVVTDSVGHILVADSFLDKIHMLDKDGHFLTYIIPNVGIETPHALAIINEGELIIGEYETGLAKTIRYL